MTHENSTHMLHHLVHNPRNKCPTQKNSNITNDQKPKMLSTNPFSNIFQSYFFANDYFCSNGSNHEINLHGINVGYDNLRIFLGPLSAWLIKSNQTRSNRFESKSKLTGLTWRSKSSLSECRLFNFAFFLSRGNWKKRRNIWGALARSINDSGKRS